MLGNINNTIINELQTGAYGKVIFDALASKYTTFRVGGKIDILIEPTSEKELIRAIRFLKSSNIPIFILGKGSNLLVSSAGIRGAVIHLGKNYADIDIDIDNDEILAQSGALLSTVSTFSFRYSLTGMEGLSGIPGSIGGAIAMNAGAYGTEMLNVVKEVRTIDLDGNIHIYDNKNMHFRYRHSRIEEDNLIVSSVVFKLHKGDKQKIMDVYNDLNQKRISKQPLDQPSAGSTFKRPDGDFASRLIDISGLRGARVGSAEVSEKHCGFVINKNGKSNFEEIMALIREIQREIKEQHNKIIETEVKIIGEIDDLKINKALNDLGFHKKIY